METKVFCVGLQKTGTSSLTVMLNKLGYDIVGYQQFRQFADDPNLTLEELETHALSVAQTKTAAKDTPWPVLYKSLDRAFPGSKFIHVIRNPESWIKSAVNDFGETHNEIHRAIYGVPYPKGHEDIWLEYYNRHNQEVAEYFSDRPDDYLQMALETELSYERVCTFLGKPIIDAHVPKANRRLKKKALLAWRRLLEKF